LTDINILYIDNIQETFTIMASSKHLYVLYGSQTGNSEQAALDFCRQAQEKLNDPKFWQQQQKKQKVDQWSGQTVVTATCMQLDDFLEVGQAKFDGTSCFLVIFVSSYGVGQAPLGAYRFRSLADELVQGRYPNLWQGLSYAVCGLGDSTYPTYLNNPTILDTALKQSGATRLLELGRADAHQMGDQAQDRVIAQWIDKLWLPLSQALVKEEIANTAVDWLTMQHQTLQILQQLDPDFEISQHSINNGSNTHANQHHQSVPVPVMYLLLGVVVAIMAIILGTGLVKL
jgi:sulfite reductase alpha subunit-like flavoprotein